MDKEQAIETLRANYPDACYEQLREAVDAAIEALKAQDAAGDKISRQAVIDVIEDYPHGVWNVENMEDMVDKIKALTSVQPEECTEKRTKTHACDLISRQAAIDALDYINGTEEVLRSLPPVQPEPHEGEWVQIQRCVGDTQPDLECPFCKHRIGWFDMGRYCAGCGAKLKGGAG